MCELVRTESDTRTNERDAARDLRGRATVDQAGTGGPRGCAATIGATGAAVVSAAGLAPAADAMNANLTRDGNGAAVSPAPLTQHGACAQWCSCDAGDGMPPPTVLADTERTVEHRSPANIGVALLA